VQENAKMSRRLKILIICLALFLGWIFIAPILAEGLIVERPLEKADAILVLGGSSVYIERTRKAAEIYKTGVAPVIFLTDDGGRAGWSRIEKRNPPYVELARKSLISEGVPAEAIVILQPTVSGTIYEAQVMAEKAKAENLQRVLIVTSAYHTRRALWTFERFFAENNVETELGIVAPSTGEQTPPPFLWWFSPRGWGLVAGEYVKFLVYWVYY
jgi:uncharacterized SAM-binding protein YcdF (DUF218 family)